MLNKEKIYQIGKQVIDIEAKSVLDLHSKIDDNFINAIKTLHDCKGHLIAIGIGKSGHIANKLAATFASTGTPAFFVHPSEASHGDLGVLRKEDVVLAISNSGTSSEILALIPAIKRLNVPLLSLTGNANSPLARASDIHLDVGVSKEACPLGLAPTASTTAALAMGDALAITLLQLRGFDKNDFALSHPGGALGKSLLLTVENIMHVGTLTPKVSPKTNIKSTLLEMTAKRLGMAVIVDEHDKVFGVFTDGDLRRVLDNDFNLHTTEIGTVMTAPCKTIVSDLLAAEALALMKNHGITSFPVVNSDQILLGVIHMHDILKSGIIPVE